MEPTAFLLVTLGFAGLVVFLHYWKEQALTDPSNAHTVHADDMRSKALLKDGPVTAILVRQSGNVYRDLGYFSTASDAFAAVEKSFQRAKIDSVRITRNTDSNFEVIRLHHSHRGRAEGEKLGGAVIAREY